MGKDSARDGDWNQPPYTFPYSCIVHKPDSTLEYYEAYKNIGRKYTILKRYDLAYDVIQAAINALPTEHLRYGLVQLKDSTSNYILNSVLTLGKCTTLAGETPYGSCLQMATDDNAITIDSTSAVASWAVKNLRIDMNNHSGHAIYGANVQQLGDHNIAVIENVKIDNVIAGKAGLYLIGLRQCELRHINIATKGTGIYLGVDDAQGLHIGNSNLSNIAIVLYAANAIGIDLEATDTYNFELLNFQRVDIMSSSTYASTIGIKMRGVIMSNFTKINVENADVALDMKSTGDAGAGQPVKYNTFIDFNCVSALTNVIKMGPNTWFNNWYGGIMGTDGAEDNIINDTNTSAYPNIFYNVRWYPGNKNFGITCMEDFEKQTSSTTKAATTPTGPTLEGRTVSVQCTDGNAIFVYINGAWHYASLT